MSSDDARAEYKAPKTQGFKVVNGKSVVLSLPSAVAIICIVVSMIAAYFVTYSDLRAEVTTNCEKIKAQDKYFEREFERIRSDLTEIKDMIKEIK